MQSSPLILEEPIRMASILEPSKPSFFPAMTKIVGTLGPKSRSVDVISQCLEAGMSEYHQEMLENLRTVIKSTRKLCVVMVKNVTRLFSTKPIVTINGKFSGPTIYAREDDIVLVKVINYVKYNVSTNEVDRYGRS